MLMPSWDSTTSSVSDTMTIIMALRNSESRVFSRALA